MMANARVIRKNFFNDPFLSRYNVEQLFFLIGLTCASDDYGTFWWKPENLKSEIYPSRKKQTKWIEKQLNLFLNDQVLCKYNENNIEYGHFPQWFDKGFCLKQRLDHPKEEQHPDCNIHLMSKKKPRKSRESSRPIESNLIESNIIKDKLIKNTQDDLFLEFKKNYPAVKFDEPTVIDAWEKLSQEDKNTSAGVIKYQIIAWEDIERRYIPKASNYLIKRRFLEKNVFDSYKEEIRIKQEKIEFDNRIKSYEKQILLEKMEETNFAE